VTEAEPVGTGAEDYNAAHASMYGSLLMHRLWSQAMEDQHPEQVQGLPLVLAVAARAARGRF
jgi:hypothetical protein